MKNNKKNEMLERIQFSFFFRFARDIVQSRASVACISNCLVLLFIFFFRQNSEWDSVYTGGTRFFEGLYYCKSRKISLRFFFSDSAQCPQTVNTRVPFNGSLTTFLKRFYMACNLSRELGALGVCKFQILLYIFKLNWMHCFSR